MEAQVNNTAFDARCSQKDSKVASSSISSDHIDSYSNEELKVWKWRADSSVSADENFIRLALVVARNSICEQGSMGAVIVKDGQVVSKGVNSSLFDEFSSDIHAEVNALGSCSRRGISTQDATCYVTMPPCRKCFTCIVASGITRIVSRKYFVPSIQNAAKARNIKLECIEDSSERLQAVHNAVVLSEAEKQKIKKLRELRKKIRKEKKRSRQTEKKAETTNSSKRINEGIGRNKFQKI
eukprot:CAMPEP_0167769616 /NCGR_PEP_ID=MMETSP0110_2-20121227/17413_1 /TAXON_ID=629695 /ORGANISM="Gymnochlora sp., Strain CCMP2014" /LENGTH=238 /DNA_ID=CAMNT_0007658603 /DNA_START=179 /DNA_END=895 /DNA_ORIENTATION=-